MIIKSMSRKEPTFGQLLAYMNREAASERFAYRHNCYGRKSSELEEEFRENARAMKARKNGVFLYHEILSITKTGDISQEERKEILRHIAAEYVYRRAAKSMVYGVLHDDHTHHLHYHLMISANEVGQSKRTRLSKAEFQALKVEMERRVRAEYPALRQQVAIEKRREGETLSFRGAELKRRTGATPERDRVKETIAEIFRESLDRRELFERLQARNLRLYVRGKTLGLVDEGSGRKYRLARLGLTERFEELSRRMEALERIERESRDGQASEARTKPRQQEEHRAAEQPHPEATTRPERLAEASKAAPPISDVVAERLAEMERIRASERSQASEQSSQKK